MNAIDVDITGNKGTSQACLITRAVPRLCVFCFASLCAGPSVLGALHYEETSLNFPYLEGDKILTSMGVQQPSPVGESTEQNSLQ